jgi:hypothetical protein
MNNLNLSLIFISLIPVITLIYLFFKMYLNSRKREQQLDIIEQCAEFNQKLINWADEISDIYIKHEYLHFCASEISKPTSGLNRNMRIKKEVIDKFIDHIPSLKQEIREEKINKILK